MHNYDELHPAGKSALRFGACFVGAPTESIDNRFLRLQQRNTSKLIVIYQYIRQEHRVASNERERWSNSHRVHSPPSSSSLSSSSELIEYRQTVVNLQRHQTAATMQATNNSGLDWFC
jgi:hypothetical protein